MRQTQLVYFDWFRRYHFLRIELRRRILLSSSKTHILDAYLRMMINFFFVHFPCWSFHSRNVSRCIYTGRKRGINTTFGMSRFIFRYRSNNGYISRVRRAQW